MELEILEKLRLQKGDITKLTYSDSLSLVCRIRRYFTDIGYGDKSRLQYNFQEQKLVEWV
jgi:hypothetical protein